MMISFAVINWGQVIIASVVLLHSISNDLNNAHSQLNT